MKIAILAGCAAVAFALAAPAQNLVITNAGIVDGAGTIIDPLQHAFSLTDFVVVAKDGKVISDDRGQHN